MLGISVRSRLGLAIALASVACDVPTETTATAHESPPSDAPSVTQLQTFSTFLGGSGNDEVTAVVGTSNFEPDFRLVAVGATASSNFPTTDGSTVDTSSAAGCTACPSDAFVTAYDAPGEIAWSRLIGGPGFERATAVARASNGDVFVGGSASALPMTAGAADPTFAGGVTAERGAEDGFVCRLDSDTGAIEWCTFIGGTGPGGVQAMVGDQDDVVVVFSTTESEALHADPLYAGAFFDRYRATAAGTDVVVIRLDGSGQTFEWATYVGGTGDEEGTPSVTTSQSTVVVATTTNSTDAYTPMGLVRFAPPGKNVYLARLYSDARGLAYGTYIGGSGDDTIEGTALSSFATPTFIAISTTSSDLPTSSGAVQPTYVGGGGAGCGSGDVWVAALNPHAQGSLSFAGATYLGGNQGDRALGIAARADNSVYVMGETYSTDFPTQPSAMAPMQGSLAGTPCTSLAGSSDGFVAGYRGYVTPFTVREFSSYMGGVGVDRVGPASSGFFTHSAFGGSTTSSAFPVHNPSQTFAGDRDGVVGIYGTWLVPSPIDAGPSIDAPSDGTVDGRSDDATAFDASGGNADDEGGGGCCGASSGESRPVPLALAVLLILTVRARVARRRSVERVGR